jgi:hypothetical protein
MLLAAALLAGCETVQPWERAYLSEREMQWVSDGREAVLINHTYSSKEAASGGFGAAGGGCGCR